MPVLNIFSVLRYSWLPPPICSEYIISHQTRVALPLKCFQNLILSSVSPFPLMPTSPPWRSLLSPALSFSWLVTLTQTHQMGQQGSDFPGPKALAPLHPQECRERSVQKSPEGPSARGASDFLTLNKDKRAFQGSFSTKEVIFYSSWSEERNVLGRTEWCSTSETWPNNLRVEVRDGLSDFALHRFEKGKCRRRAWVYFVCVYFSVCVCVFSC